MRIWFASIITMKMSLLNKIQCWLNIIVVILSFTVLKLMLSNIYWKLIVQDQRLWKFASCSLENLPKCTLKKFNQIKISQSPNLKKTAPNRTKLIKTKNLMRPLKRKVNNKKTRTKTKTKSQRYNLKKSRKLKKTANKLRKAKIKVTS